MAETVDDLGSPRDLFTGEGNPNLPPDMGPPPQQQQQAQAQAPPRRHAYRAPEENVYYMPAQEQAPSNVKRYVFIGLGVVALILVCWGGFYLIGYLEDRKVELPEVPPQ